MNPSEFIGLAGKMLAASKEGTPAIHRTVTSRAYYGAFHAAKSLLAALNHSPPQNANAHVFVVQCLSACKHKHARLAGSLLGDLHSYRISADYKLESSEPDSVARARESVEIAVQVESLLSKCADGQSQSDIQAEIQAYRKVSMR